MPSRSANTSGRATWPVRLTAPGNLSKLCVATSAPFLTNLSLSKRMSGISFAPERISSGEKVWYSSAPEALFLVISA